MWLQENGKYPMDTDFKDSIIMQGTFILKELFNLPYVEACEVLCTNRNREQQIHISNSLA